MVFAYLVAGLLVGTVLGWFAGAATANARLRRQSMNTEADMLEREERLLRARAERLGLTVAEPEPVPAPTVAEAPTKAAPRTSNASMDKLFSNF